MKITIVTGPWLPTPAIEGGSTNRIWQGLAEQFAAAGHSVTIVSKFYPKQPNEEIINDVKYLRYGGFKQTGSISEDITKDFVYALSTLWKLPGADILVLNDFWLPVFSWLRKSAGKIVVIAGRYPKGQYKLYFKAQRIVCVSHAVREAILGQCKRCSPRLSVAPNPIDLEVLHEELTKREQIVLYAGRIHPEKGLELLIDAFSLVYDRLPKALLRIIGPSEITQGGGGATYLTALKKRADEKSVKFMGPIFDLKKLAAEYRAARVFCYPSLAERGEAFGVAPLEAMACGAIPVVSKLRCFEDTVLDNETGFIFDHRGSGAIDNLTKALLTALDDSPQNKQIVKNGISKAKEFSYHKVAQQYLKLFNELII